MVSIHWLDLELRPDRPFHNFRASKSGDLRILCSSGKLSDVFGNSKLQKNRSGSKFNPPILSLMFFYGLPKCYFRWKAIFCYPDRTLHNVRAQKCVDWHFWRKQKSQIQGLWGSWEREIMFWTEIIMQTGRAFENLKDQNLTICGFCVAQICG